MKERDIEAYLREKIREHGGWAPKWVSPGNNGVPDRIVIMPGGRIVFVELKAPSGKLTKLQLKQHERLQALGCEVRVVNSYEKVNALIQEMIQN